MLFYNPTCYNCLSIGCARNNSIHIPCNKCVTISCWRLKCDGIFNCIFAWIFLVVCSFTYGIAIAKIVDNTVFNSIPTCGDSYITDSAFFDILIPPNESITFSCQFAESNCVFHSISGYVHAIINVLTD